MLTGSEAEGPIGGNGGRAIQVETRGKGGGNRTSHCGNGALYGGE